MWTPVGTSKPETLQPCLNILYHNSAAHFGYRHVRHMMKRKAVSRALALDAQPAASERFQRGGHHFAHNLIHSYGYQGLLRCQVKKFLTRGMVMGAT